VSGPYKDLTRRIHAARKRKKGVRLKGPEVVVLDFILDCPEAKLKGAAFDYVVQEEERSRKDMDEIDRALSCDCENPPPYPGAEGVYHVSISCPEHGDG